MTHTGTFKTSISLPADLARFVDEEVEIAGHQHRSKTIHQALRLMQSLKRKLESLPAAAESVELEGIAFSREEVASLFPQWGEGAAGAGEHRTLNSKRRASKGANFLTDAGEAGAGAEGRANGQSALAEGSAPLTPAPALAPALPAGDQAASSQRVHPGSHEPALSNATSSTTGHSRAGAFENRESRIENSPAQ